MVGKRRRELVGLEIEIRMSLSGIPIPVKPARVREIVNRNRSVVLTWIETRADLKSPTACEGLTRIKSVIIVGPFGSKPEPKAYVK